MRWSYLGRVEYGTALALQMRLRDEIGSGVQQDTLVLLEHPPVITLGRSASAANVLASSEELARRGIARHATERGGDVTYHGPGQLVGYPIRRVGRAVKPHVQGMASALIATLADHGVEGHWSGEAPGVWTERGKVAAVGVDARGGVAIHGFALNVRPDLSHYDVIVPCGLRKPVTSLRQLGVDPLPSLVTTAARIAEHLAAAYGVPLVAACPGDILDGEILAGEIHARAAKEQPW